MPRFNANNFYAIIILLMLFTNAIISQPNSKTVDLFIWAGQSNAQGWMGDGSFYPDDNFHLDDSIRLNYTFFNNTSSQGRWIKMQPQDGRFAKGHFGPEVSFSRKLKQAGYNPAVFKFTLGGTSIYNDWKTPGQGGMYDEMVAAFKKAVDSLIKNGYTVEIKGFIWIQGESDAENDLMANDYYKNLKMLINDVRKYLTNNESLPVVLGVDEMHPWVKERPIIIDAQKRLAGEEKNIVFTSMVGLPKADDTHLTPAGLISHGERIFNGYISSIDSSILSSKVNRADDFDVFPGFKNPPPGFGEVPFYWWMGDSLTKERLLWQLDKLSGKGISSLQINYAHSDKGGIKWGLSYPSQPAVFTEEWWDLFGWFMRETNKRGMAVSLSDYTLGLGQGSYVDEMIKDDPSLLGTELFFESKEAEEFTSFFWDLPNNWLSIKAYRTKDKKIMPGSGIDLRNFMSGRYLTWYVPKGEWIVTCVYAKKKEYSLDPMNPNSGTAYIEKFFKRFEDRFPGEAGKGLNFFFSDELDFNLYGVIWNNLFAAEFEKRKAYSILPYLAGLFIDIGPETPKVRLDYNDVMVTLSEEGFFKPIFDWQQERGMIYGCDHGGRGKDVTEFGDYFRTQRWNQGPGCDQPFLSQDIVKNKVASSIAHLYQRPHTWLEGFHSSGWSTSSADLADAVFSNFMMGQNLLSLHGLYYSTHGGWWEWAPPCNHFRMPYYEHIEPLMKCIERLSYLFSQGYHQCDVAVLYPVEPVIAKMDGELSVKTAFDTGEYLYNRGIDFDFIDYESIARSNIINNELHIAGEKYKVLIIPSMKAIRFSTLQKALEFYRAGGIVINIGTLPCASERTGLGDPEIDKMLLEIFGESANDSTFGKIKFSRNNGKGICVKNTVDAEIFLNKNLQRDFKILSDSAGEIKPRMLHRKIGSRDIYAVYNVPKNTECFFRAKGKIELWNPYTGEAESNLLFKEIEGGVLLKLPLEKTEVNLIVFDSDGTSNNSQSDNLTYGISTAAEETVIPLDGEWEFEVKPVLDNRWGDYYWPPTNELIGPEIRRTKYYKGPADNDDMKNPDFDDSNWTEVSNGFGPQFYKLGPLPDDIGPRELEKISGISRISTGDSILLSDKYFYWRPYSFSWRYGVENDPGHQGWHGLKEQIYDDFIRLGEPSIEWTNIVYKKEDGGKNYLLYTNLYAPAAGIYQILTGEIKPAAFWINGVRYDSLIGEIKLNSGNNKLLLYFDQPCTTYFIVKKEGDNRNKSLTGLGSLAMNWYGDRSILKFNIYPNDKVNTGWYRFRSAPGLKKIKFAAYGNLKAWIDNVEYKVIKGDARPDGSYNYVIDTGAILEHPASVVFMIEHETGFYGGAALPEPVKLECGKGIFQTGDWSLNGGLYSYSGGVWYRKNISLIEEQIKGNVMLDLGSVVSSAEVFVNGMEAGIKLSAPYSYDISKLVKPGENKIEVLVYNTAANHYTTIPTRYRGSIESGLIGPVTIKLTENK